MLEKIDCKQGRMSGFSGEKSSPDWSVIGDEHLRSSVSSLESQGSYGTFKNI